MDRETVLFKILKKMEASIDRILLLMGMIVVLLGFSLFYMNGMRFFSFFDMVAGVGCLTAFVSRKKLSAKFKLILLLVLLMVFSFFSLVFNGFVGNGMLTLAISQVLAASFFGKRGSALISLLGILTVLFGMASFVSGYSTLTESLVLYNAQIFPWLVHLASLLIFTIVCYIVVFSIRKQLIGNIEALEDTVETLNVRNELLEKKEAEIRQFAYFDTLTTLPNRYFFGDYVQKRLSVAESGYIALLDIRDFKMINSIYGTEVGDEILRELGILMNSFQKSPNLIARLSANEFAGWAEDWDHAHFLNRIADFNALINEKLMALTHKFHLDFYFVYARYPEDGHDFDTLFKHATVAMKFAKDRSTTEYIEFLPSMLNEVEDEERYKNAIEAALKEEEFSLYYQSKVSIADASVFGVEALARWHSKSLGEISPAKFIPLVCQSKWVVPFSEWVIKQALDDYPALTVRYGHSVELSINISPTFFFKPHFESFVIHEIEMRNIPFEKIILEITEDIFLHEVEGVERKITALRAKGIKLSLDDFGTGYSSLSYLSRYVFDELKIDKSFVDNVVRDKRALALFESIMQIARTFNYHVIAEGVETREQLEVVRNVGCTNIQGFLFSRPAGIGEHPTVDTGKIASILAE